MIQYNQHWNSERGSALIVSLIMLLLLSLITLSGMQSTILQERMASNLHDRNIAFQASERALREGENWLADNFGLALTNGRLESPSEWDGTGDDSVTLDTDDPQLSGEPSYHIGYVADFCVPATFPPKCYERFAVTSRGQGGTEQSIVILQSMFMPTPP